MKLAYLLTLLLGLTSEGVPVEATSLLGEALVPPEIPAEVRADFEAKLEQARADAVKAPDDPDAAIWLGRRTAYLGRYREAIDVYTRALAHWPQDARLYRHRGHRYLTTRQLDRALADFRRAAELIAGTADEVEPDGLPNARNIPTSTLHTNVWYHLGLTHYVRGEFEAALKAYRACLEASQNPDMMVATVYWMVNTLIRLDRQEEIEALLTRITRDLDIIENHGYHRLLLLHKGKLEEDEVRDPGDDGVGDATVGYGVAMWHLDQGRPERYRELLDAVLEGPSWAAFGYLAAEADVAADRSGE